MSAPNAGLAVQFIDGYARNVTRRYRVDETTLAGIITARTTIKNALLVLVDGAVFVVRAWVRYAFSDSAADDGANVDEGATFSCDLGDGRTGAFKIPTIDKGFIAGDGSVSMEDTEIIALVALFEGAAPRFLVSDGEAVVSVVSGRLDT